MFKITKPKPLTKKQIEAYKKYLNGLFDLDPNDLIGVVAYGTLLKELWKLMHFKDIRIVLEIINGEVNIKGVKGINEDLSNIDLGEDTNTNDPLLKKLQKRMDTKLDQTIQSYIG